MSVMEGELEILLGELHIKMKGTHTHTHTHTHTVPEQFTDYPVTRYLLNIEHVLSLPGLIGFARLCPGDQYEVSSSVSR